jgi:hypothetical protein
MEEIESRDLPLQLSPDRVESLLKAVNELGDRMYSIQNRSTRALLEDWKTMRKRLVKE